MFPLPSFPSPPYLQWMSPPVKPHPSPWDSHTCFHKQSTINSQVISFSFLNSNTHLPSLSTPLKLSNLWLMSTLCFHQTFLFPFSFLSFCSGLGYVSHSTWSEVCCVLDFSVMLKSYLLSLLICILSLEDVWIDLDLGKCHYPWVPWRSTKHFYYSQYANYHSKDNVNYSPWNLQGPSLF